MFLIDGSFNSTVKVYPEPVKYIIMHAVSLHVFFVFVCVLYVNVEADEVHC